MFSTQPENLLFAAAASQPHAHTLGIGDSFKVVHRVIHSCVITSL